MVVQPRVMFVLVALAFHLVAQDHEGEIRGSIVSGKQPVSNAQVETREQNGRTPVQFATTAVDGTYVLHRLPRGIYTLRVSAAGFHSTEVHDIQLDEAPVTLPGVPLEVGLIADCGTDRPAYYRVSPGSAAPGGIGGVIISDKAVPLRGATVTLYVKGKGRIGSQRTSERGFFRFEGLQVQSEEYWVSIEHEGFFVDEVRKLFVFPGLESVYTPITMQACSPGNCQPYLKAIRVLPTCA